ncbi:hypothetical protein SPNHU17_01032 [Streptococcus pneumoniae]|nr:hypothetical protein SPNHU17_01032 [Streptococcus pneumoniae]
MGKSLLTD